MMNKAQNKNRKHPTCSRCRFHGKKDIRVLQHQCPFRNCTCSSCFLIKRRSIIYRAQKNLDKTEDISNEAESPGGSGDGSVSNSFSEMNSKNSTNCSISRSSDSSSDATNFGSNCFSLESSHNNTSVQTWKESEQSASTSSLPSNPVKSPDHYKISDFQSLCLTFPELTASQLQSIFEQCGNDFQRTIDRVLMSKWCDDTDCKPIVQFHNNNDWWSTSTDYASNTIPSIRSPQTTSSIANEGMATNFYNANNGQNAYDWRSNGGIDPTNDDLCSSDYVNDYYYDQSMPSSCAVISTQGNHQTVGDNNWNYDYSGYWYSNSQGSHTSNGSTGSYDMSSGYQFDETGWSNGQIGNCGPVALGPVTPITEYNI